MTHTYKVYTTDRMLLVRLKAMDRLGISRKGMSAVASRAFTALLIRSQVLKLQEGGFSKVGLLTNKPKSEFAAQHNPPSKRLARRGPQRKFPSELELLVFQVAVCSSMFANRLEYCDKALPSSLSSGSIEEQWR